MRQALALCLALVACGPAHAPAPPTAIAPEPVAVAPDPGPSRADLIAASRLPEPQPVAVPGDPMAVTIHRLSNGMTVYISTNREKPLISARVAVRAGSSDDPPQSTGLAHYLEHMMFKGTGQFGTTDIADEQPHLERIAALYRELRATDEAAKRAAILEQLDAETQKSAAYAVPNELTQLYDRLGITGVNAYTNNDRTVYLATVPSNRFEAWARVESDRFRDPRFRLFFTEIETVYEEKNRSMDSAARRVNEALTAALFPHHPYGTQTTLGDIEHLKNPAFDDMVGFFHRWYVPNNMAIILAGDIDAATALPMLEQTFGAALEPEPLPPPTPPDLPPPAGRVVRELDAEGESSVQLAWLTVAENHPDQPVLDVMDRLVDNAECGLLNLELILTQKLPSAGSYPNFYDEAGYWALWGVAREGQSLEEVEALLRGVVDRLKAGEFTQADIDAILVNEEIAEKRALESNGARAGRMTEAFTSGQPWPEAVRRLDRLRAVTRDQVIRAANQYLTDDFVVVRRNKGEYLPPKIAKPEITPLPIASGRHSPLARTVEALTAPELEPEWIVEGTHFTRIATPDGDLIATPNPRNDLFDLRYRFDLGRRKAPLLCHALNLLDRSGDRELTASELKKKLYAMGTSVSTYCGVDRTSITLTGLDRNLEASVSLLERWLRTARFDAKTVKDLAANTISRRKDRIDEPWFVAGALADYAQWGKESDYLIVPSNRALERVRGRKLGKLLADLPDYQHATAYFGPRPADQVAKAVALGRRHRKLAERPPARYRKSTGVTIYFADKKTSQAKIRIALPGPPMTNADRALSAFYSEYLDGGMGALIFQEIREARSLAYSAWGGHSVGTRPDDDAVVYAGLGTQNDKAVGAIRAMLGLLRQMPIEQARVDGARTALDRAYRAIRVEPRSVADWVLYWDETGETPDPRAGRWQALRAVDADALAAFAAAAADRPVIISVVGDKSRIDMDGLAALGKLEVRTIDQLVGY